MSVVQSGFRPIYVDCMVFRLVQAGSRMNGAGKLKIVRISGYFAYPLAPLASDKILCVQ